MKPQTWVQAIGFVMFIAGMVWLFAVIALIRYSPTVYAELGPLALLGPVASIIGLFLVNIE